MVMSCRKWLRGSTIGAATLSVAILWALPSANAASGGGCSRASSQGFRISSCISAHFENPLSTRIIPDYYIDAVPNLGGDTCYIDWILYKDTQYFKGDVGSCITGHVVVPYQPNNSGNYYLKIEVVTKSKGLILTADSPVQFN
jgi:hypothetical protein